MTKKFVCSLLAVMILLSLAGCTGAQPKATTPTGTAGYTVTVHSQGGLPLQGVQVFVYSDESLSTMVNFGQTNAEGTVSLHMPQQEGYVITLESLPRGYNKEASYSFSDRHADISLTTSLISQDDLAGKTLGVGDVMFDFTVKTADGSSVTLSELLAEKDMVLLNFFFTTCGPCASEFPYMQEAYDMYDSVGIIALDPLDAANDVADYQQSMGLTFPMAACSPAFAQIFNLQGYPTNVVVDRYGVICLIEVGGLTSLQPFTTIFDAFTGDGYTQTLYGSLSEMITTAKPNCTMASSEEVSAILGTENLDITYSPETKEPDAEYSWPFVETTKNGETCLKASNQGMDRSYAILYAYVPLKAGQALAFDYLSSTESGCDILYIIVDGEDTYRISGYDQEEVWQTCYPWVATADGTYRVAFCYWKDSDTAVADDTVYIKNLRIVAQEEIDTPTYISHQAATSQDGYTYQYADIHLGKDGYYHVDSPEGPLLMADLMNYTQFAEEQTIWSLVYESGLMLGEQSFYDAMVHHFSYASNSSIAGITPVNEDLLGYLKIVDQQFGFDPADENEWMKCCLYYAAYGTQEQLSNPIAGLCTDAALEAKLGVGVETNYFYYDRPIMPRGMLAAFTPKKSGVYLITSHSDSPNGVEGWIFSGEIQDEAMAVYQPDQRMQEDVLNLHMYFYMEAGKTYYLDICFWDMYETGYIYYDIEYVGKTEQVFRLASPGYFTYDPGATGEDMYALVAGGIDVVLGEDGIYYHDLGGGKKGSKLYCDFTGITGIFGQPLTTVQAYEDGEPAFDEYGQPIMVKGIIQRGGFNFAMTENDQFIQSYIDQHGGDVEATDAYLQELWGEEYDSYAQLYQVQDVYAGKYHGRGEDYTDEMLAFADQMITKGPAERRGCVVVTEELAFYLQMLMDKFTFGGVDHSWTKLCYYYEYLGPQ